MSRAQLALTPEAVATVLTGAGFEAAQMDEHSYRPVSEGFITSHLAVAPRVGVYWNASPYHGDRGAFEIERLRICARELGIIGYQVELVINGGDRYLVVWVEGEF